MVENIGLLMFAWVGKLVRRTEDISSDIERQLEAKGTEFFFLFACDGSSHTFDASFFLKEGEFLCEP